MQATAATKHCKQAFFRCPAPVASDAASSLHITQRHSSQPSPPDPEEAESCMCTIFQHSLPGLAAEALALARWHLACRSKHWKPGCTPDATPAAKQAVPGSRLCLVHQVRVRTTCTILMTARCTQVERPTPPKAERNEEDGPCHHLAPSQVTTLKPTHTWKYLLKPANTMRILVPTTTAVTPVCTATYTSSATTT